MKTLFLSVLRQLIFLLLVSSLLSAITPLGITPFPTVAVAVTCLNIILLIVLSFLYLCVSSHAKTDPSALLKMTELGKPYKWVARTVKAIIIFILLAWAGYTFLAVSYAVVILLYRIVEYGTRQEYKKYSEDKAP